MVTQTLSDLPGSIAIAHEWFTPFSSGGAEKVVKVIDQVLLNSGVKADFAAIIDDESLRPNSWLYGRNVKTSFISFNF